MAAELSYFFYLRYVNQPQKEITSTASLLTPAIETTFPSSSPIPTITSSGSALNADALELMKTINKGGYVSSTAEFIYEGTINWINKEGGFFHFNYDIAFTLEKENTFFFTSDEVNKITAVQKGENTETSIILSDLNVGDKIKLELTFDLSKPLKSNLLKGKITKF